MRDSNRYFDLLHQKLLSCSDRLRRVCDWCSALSASPVPFWLDQIFTARTSLPRSCTHRGCTLRSYRVRWPRTPECTASLCAHEQLASLWSYWAPCYLFRASSDPNPPSNVCQSRWMTHCPQKRVDAAEAYRRLLGLPHWLRPNLRHPHHSLISGDSLAWLLTTWSFGWRRESLSQ